MKRHPKKSAENSALLGAWRQPATNVCTPLKARRGWHKARREGRLGEQITRRFEDRYGVKDSKAAAATMTMGSPGTVEHSSDWAAWASTEKELDMGR